ncbi:MAG TPA: TolC family protein [Anaeromyxobacteraceae bacterium]|nr:TolC family protein [Anaeromyxobacteraceae bacterium]
MTLFATALAAAVLAAPAPLTLDEALAEASRKSPELRAARADRDAALGDRTVAWSNVLPRLDLTAAFGRQYIGETSTTLVSGYQLPGTPATTLESYQLGLRLEQPLFDGLRSWALVSAGKARAAAAEGSLDESGLSVAFGVTRAFLEVVRAERNLEVLEEAVGRSEEVRRRAEALYQAGRLPKSDAIAASVNLGNDRILVEVQRGRVTRARVDLCLALGRDADPGLSVVPPAALLGPGGPSSEEPPTPEALLQAARRSRPLLRAQRNLIDAAESDLRAAHGGYWPALSLVLGYDRTSPYFAGVYGNLSRQYTASGFITLTWNFFDGLRTTGGVDRATAMADRARAGSDQAEQQVSGELAAARDQVVLLGRTVRLSTENLAVAEQGLQLARDRLDKGAATQLEVRDAQLKLTQARLALIAARIDEAIAHADLNRATGAAL